MIWINGVEVKLGMPKEQVTKLFSVNHELRQVEGSDGWFIVKKGSENNVVENVVGSVWFEKETENRQLKLGDEPRARMHLN